MNKTSDLAVDIRNLSKTYPGRIALNNVTFSVRKGSVHGFLGPNGAGKSTTLKIISGLIPQSSGDYTVSGKVGFLPEHPPLYPNMTVKDYLKFVLDIYAPDKNAISNVLEVMNKTGLSTVSERLIGNLSKGYQQRVGIAQALVHSPEIIILDEPTVGLDPVAMADIRELIKKLKKDHTIIFSTHQLHDVELLCSDITLINHGDIVVSGPLEQILESLKTKLALSAKVEHFSEEERVKLVKKFNLESAESQFDHEKKNYHLKIILKGSAQIKKEIAQYLATDGIGLLEFFEEKLDLEELFVQMIH